MKRAFLAITFVACGKDAAPDKPAPSPPTVTAPADALVVDTLFDDVPLVPPEIDVPTVRVEVGVPTRVGRKTLTLTRVGQSERGAFAVTSEIPRPKNTSPLPDFGPGFDLDWEPFAELAIDGEGYLFVPDGDGLQVAHLGRSRESSECYHLMSDEMHARQLGFFDQWTSAANGIISYSEGGWIVKCALQTRRIWFVKDDKPARAR